MRHLSVSIAAFSLFGSLALSQNPAQSFNASKFDAVYRAAKSVDAIATVGISYSKLDDLLQAYTSEISIARDRASTPLENTLVKFYEEALSIYRDSLVIWKAKIDNPSVKLFPYVTLLELKDAIPYSTVLEVARRNALPPILYWEDPHLELEVIPAECLQYLWYCATDKLARANSIYLGRPMPKPLPSKEVQIAALYHSYKSRLEQEKIYRENVKEVYVDGNAGTVYHFDYSCPQLPEGRRRGMTYIAARNKGYTPCPICVPMKKEPADTATKK